MIFLFKKTAKATKGDTSNLELSNEEKKRLCRVARLIASESTTLPMNNAKEITAQIPSRLKALPLYVDVTIWINGQVRGSSLSFEKKFEDSFYTASRLCLHDERFLPIEKSELEIAQFEINIISSERTRLVPQRSDGKPDPTCGYMLLYGGKEYVYLPTMYDLFNYKSLYVLLIDLLTNKASLSLSLFNDCSFFSFPVTRFIESVSPSSDSPQKLLKALYEEETTSTTQLLESLKTIGGSIIEHITRIKEETGNIPTRISPRRGVFVFRDFPRLAHTVWALAYYGKVFKNKEAMLTSEKAFAYLQKYVSKTLRSPFDVASAVYITRAARELSLPQIKKEWLDLLLKYKDQETLPLTVELNLYSLFLEEEVPRKEIIENRIIRLVEEIVGSSKLKTHHDLGSASEILYCLKLLSKTPSSLEIKNLLEQMIQHYNEQQLIQGAFPTSRQFISPTSRGTAKIIEALTVDYKKYKKIINSALAWLFTLQYQENSLYAVLPHMRPSILGGFRHDEITADIWIDTSSHLLIALCRIHTQVS